MIYSGISYMLYIRVLHCHAVNRVSIQVADACFDSLLVPGQVPEIKGVTRMMKVGSQLMSSGASKIRTIIYYGQDGKVRAVGAEAIRDGIYEIAEDKNWVGWRDILYQRNLWEMMHLVQKLNFGFLRQSLTQDFELTMS